MVAIDLKIPSPDYYVFYNGRDKPPDRQDLKLSDSFITPKKGDALLVKYTREYQTKGVDLKEAVEQAINRCIQENELKSYLLKWYGGIFLLVFVPC